MPGVKKRSIIAVMRKLTTRTRHMISDQTPYLLGRAAKRPSVGHPHRHHFFERGNLAFNFQTQQIKPRRQ